MTIQESFERYHERHPEVFAHLKTLCDRWLAHGNHLWSIKAAYNVLRWERRMAVTPDDTEEYRLPDQYHSRYARLLMKDKKYEHLFVTRGLRTA